eukprot:TRINITY_DN7848_c0_g1_i2.p1 TRINITY_DN7848_c0_g1~~TRINITY_DN7848_c0_g1_i2.p1  ORF type:complete len:214 (+),score=34.61 TRINITY_DN7848_c0_g1_i2:611-1252(+)
MVADLDQYSFARARVNLIISLPGRFPISKLQNGSSLSLWKLGKKLEERGFRHWKLNPLIVQTSNVGSLGSNWLDVVLSVLGINTQIKVVYPSETTVQSSLHPSEGWYFNICKGTYNNVYDCYDDRFPGLWLHSKLYIQEDDNRNGWCFSGSQNLSKSAWGNIEGEYVNMRNFEIGILLFYQNRQFSYPIPIDTIKNEAKPMPETDSHPWNIVS